MDLYFLTDHNLVRDEDYRGFLEKNSEITLSTFNVIINSQWPCVQIAETHARQCDRRAYKCERSNESSKKMRNVNCMRVYPNMDKWFFALRSSKPLSPSRELSPPSSLVNRKRTRIRKKRQDQRVSLTKSSIPSLVLNFQNRNDKTSRGLLFPSSTVRKLLSLSWANNDKLISFIPRISRYLGRRYPRSHWACWCTLKLQILILCSLISNLF